MLSIICNKSSLVNMKLVILNTVDSELKNLRRNLVGELTFFMKFHQTPLEDWNNYCIEYLHSRCHLTSIAGNGLSLSKMIWIGLNRWNTLMGISSKGNSGTKLELLVLCWFFEALLNDLFLCQRLLRIIHKFSIIS